MMGIIAAAALCLLIGALLIALACAPNNDPSIPARTARDGDRIAIALGLGFIAVADLLIWWIA